MMYLVVEFSNGSVEVVPDIWLLNYGKSAYWPPSRGKKLISDIQEKRVPDSSWKKCSVKQVMRKCGKSRHVYTVLSTGLITVGNVKNLISFVGVKTHNNASETATKFSAVLGHRSNMND